MFENICQQLQVAPKVCSECFQSIDVHTAHRILPKHWCWHTHKLYISKVFDNVCQQLHVSSEVCTECFQNIDVNTSTNYISCQQSVWYICQQLQVSSIVCSKTLQNIDVHTPTNYISRLQNACQLPQLKKSLPNNINKQTKLTLLENHDWPSWEIILNQTFFRIWTKQFPNYLFLGSSQQLVRKAKHVRSI